MKNRYLFLALPLFAFALPTQLPIGADIPNADLPMKDVGGKEITLKESAKKNGLLVMFSCNTCPYVRRNQQRTREIARLALSNEIGVILVNANAAERDGDDSFEGMQRYAAEQGYQWPYVVDEKNRLADAFGATRTPENYLFNKEGKLVYRGAIDDNPDESNVTRKHLRIAIEEMLAGKEVTVNTTRSVGCGIKRIR